MDLTFISIHDLTPDARVLYSSDSIVDVLGWTPDEVVNRSCWEFFSEDELPFAQAFHKKGVQMDKAAVLSYCRVKNKEGQWTGVECCFTIVYDVMIVCTSIYRRGSPSQKRAEEAPIIRRLFSSSPRDPRYHMLSHISDKFRRPVQKERHEPRAALFLNRFTRTLTIMYATAGLEEILGIPAESMRGCYQVSRERKGERLDSLPPLLVPGSSYSDDATTPMDEESDDEMTASSVDQEVGGGVHINGSHSASENMDVDPSDYISNSRTTSGNSTDAHDTHSAIFGDSMAEESSAASSVSSPDGSTRPQINREPIELEAVISCTSDGLVVCLRRARPMLPTLSRTRHNNGLFAAPWATEPILPPMEARPQQAFATNFAPSLGPFSAHTDHVRAGGPAQDDFMNSIREQAIFAWALTGINGALHQYGVNKPHGESLPLEGLEVWESDPYAQSEIFRSDSGSGLDGMTKSHSPAHMFGDPGLDGYRKK
ncbi:MAG: Signal recognition particle 14kD protein [Aureobasidium pullulans]|nr:MAG: Signal recognition particle 14kD protein [Aureobasidium pullulans]